jgi:hypothetical protein
MPSRSAKPNGNSLRYILKVPVSDFRQLAILSEGLRCCPRFIPENSLKVADDWLALLLRIHEVSDSNLGPKSRYPDRGFLWFSLVPSDKFRGSNLY